MDFRRLADSYLRQADYRLRVARRALRDRQYAYTVRLSQESVELALKSLLRRVNVEYPKFHDVGEVLVINRDLFDEALGRQIEDLAAASTELMRLRPLTAYGDEARALPPEQIFSRSDAETALAKATWVLQTCKKG